MVEGDNGWTEWVSPRPNKPYYMACCDCGLVHELQFDAYEVHERKRGGWWRGEPILKPFQVLFRARRNDRKTADQRAKAAA